jgi:hypothetical protein
MPTEAQAEVDTRVAEEIKKINLATISSERRLVSTDYSYDNRKNSVYASI